MILIYCRTLPFIICGFIIKSFVKLVDIKTNFCGGCDRIKGCGKQVKVGGVLFYINELYEPLAKTLYL